MAYEPTVWNTGDVITAEKLNKLENGVGEVSKYAVVGSAFFSFSDEANELLPVTFTEDIGVIKERIIQNDHKNVKSYIDLELLENLDGESKTYLHELARAQVVYPFDDSARSLLACLYSRTVMLGNSEVGFESASIGADPRDMTQVVGAFYRGSCSLGGGLLQLACTMTFTAMNEGRNVGELSNITDKDGNEYTISNIIDALNSGKTVTLACDVAMAGMEQVLLHGFELHLDSWSYTETNGSTVGFSRSRTIANSASPALWHFDVLLTDYDGTGNNQCVLFIKTLS